MPRPLWATDLGLLHAARRAVEEAAAGRTFSVVNPDGERARQAVLRRARHAGVLVRTRAIPGGLLVLPPRMFDTVPESGGMMDAGTTEGAGMKGEIANRVEKAMRLADAMQEVGERAGLPPASVADMARTMSPQDWALLASGAGERRPSEQTTNMVVTMLASRARDPFEGLA